MVGSSAVAMGRVWFGPNDGYMHCVNQTNGLLLWEFKVQAAYGSTGSANTLVDYVCTHWLTGILLAYTLVRQLIAILACWLTGTLPVCLTVILEDRHTN